jgi:signal transduction histidine kinase
VASGSLARASDPVDAAAVVGDVVRSYDVVADHAGVGIDLNLGFDRCTIRGDRTCLTVLFDNLIDNAIKYNRDGGTVRVSGEIVGGDAVIRVADSGIGVAAEHLPFLFDEFYRVKGSGERKTAGTGLGLPICRRIVTELGGRIEVESTAGVGTTFSVILPLIQSDEHAAESGRATESESYDQDTDS